MALEFEDGIDYPWDDDYVTCPTCGGPGGFMGALGRLDWFRCINCGIDFNHDNGGSNENSSI